MSQSDTDDIDVDEALEDAVISYVNMDARENVALSCSPQDSMEYGRDINVIRHDGNLKKVQETKGYYDPLQYPILFPFGTHGWDVNTTNWRLRWIKEHQSDMRAELYQGLQDALHVGETNAENIGKRTILPSSFIGGRRDMTQCYEDGMVIVLNGGKPDIFLTMTCNPSWSEITTKLLSFQIPQDRPDLLKIIFRSKFEQLKDGVINKGVLGKVKTYMYVTEF
ncbi:hypothetical protein KIW84_020828 [Lathyrus oleraceus]|uniref:Helitron helicase-like domain-containing protein n=1 Tax=Pisum sativum TaxID=3888 RepID=A0A9D4YA38_PEA|nr:hypothetical protein KIW84_020828 [Pisum sativum]